MRRSAIFCAPSITARDGCREGFGMAFAEAQACGLPVVSYDVGGIPEAVGKDIGGLLVREGDWHALAAALDILLTDENLRIAYGEAGKRRTSRMFDLRCQTPLLESLYERVLTSPALAGNEAR
jgi:glycosyltransferase involved in cell wall biosynthesis